MDPKRKGTSLSGATYQVFLSFRGPDTRLGFADVLYHALTDAGIRVFRDDEEIRKGEDIGDEILMAISESRIFVPIFSSGYASSKWCLIELSKMLESKEASPDSNKKILPIFYDVDADDVKLKTELYVDPLLKHREKILPIFYDVDASGRKHFEKLERSRAMRRRIEAMGNLPSSLSERFPRS